MKNDKKKAGDPSKNEGALFTMDHVRHISGLKDHNEAKKYAHDIVTNHPTARDENRSKAHAMINKSKSPSHLAMGMSNFILAHQGMNVLKSIENEEDMESLIKKLKEIKEKLKEVNSKSNGSTKKGILSEPRGASRFDAEKIDISSNGQWKLNKAVETKEAEQVEEKGGRESKWAKPRKDPKTGEPAKEVGPQMDEPDKK